MGSNPHANGGKLLRELDMPDFRDYAVDVPAPTAVNAGNVHVLGPFLRDVIKRNEESEELPGLRPRRDDLEPPGSGLRGHRSPVGWRHGGE